MLATMSEGSPRYLKFWIGASSYVEEGTHAQDFDPMLHRRSDIENDIAVLSNLPKKTAQSFPSLRFETRSTRPHQIETN
jgi:hypothetical protein